MFLLVFPSHLLHLMLSIVSLAMLIILAKHNFRNAVYLFLLDLPIHYHLLLYALLCTPKTAVVMFAFFCAYVPK